MAKARTVHKGYGAALYKAIVAMGGSYCGDCIRYMLTPHVCDPYWASRDFRTGRVTFATNGHVPLVGDVFDDDRLAHEESPNLVAAD